MITFIMVKSAQDSGQSSSVFGQRRAILACFFYGQKKLNGNKSVMLLITIHKPGTFGISEVPNMWKSSSLVTSRA